MMADRDTAGASAAKEYERRRANDEARIRDRWGRLGSLAIALSPERQSTAAWKSGALGERKVAERLDKMAGKDVVALHDRRLPRSRANLDHLLITAGGVWVIDAKRYVNKRPGLRVHGGFWSPRRERLVVQGSDKTALVESVLRQVATVRAEVADVPVYGALCFVDADWPLLGRGFSVNEVFVGWPDLVAERAAQVASVGIDVPQVATALSRAFRAQASPLEEDKRLRSSRNP